MFFDEIKLSRNSWHYKLQSIMFGSPPFVNNFCPYFWLTIFCLLVSPFVYSAIAIYKLSLMIYQRIIVHVITKIDGLMDNIETNICKPFIENIYRSFDDTKIYKLYHEVESREGTWKENAKFRREFETWKKAVGDGWMDKLREIKEKHEKQKKEEYRRQKEYQQKERERQKKIELKKQNRKKVFTKIANYTKWIVTPVVVLCGIFLSSVAIYLLGLGIVRVSKYFYTIWNIKVVIACLIIVALIVVAVIIGFLASKLLNKLSDCIIYIPKTKKTKPYTKPLSDRMLDFIEKLTAPFQIFIEYIKVFKQNNCPAIIWKEDEK